MTLSLLHTVLIIDSVRHLGLRLVRVTTTRDPGPRSVTAGVHTSVNNHAQPQPDHVGSLCILLRGSCRRSA